MADLYLDHGRYAYAATPTWNVAQEGDGLASGTAVPAIASIAFSATPTSGTVSVAGASVSTTGVLNAASADAAANALATNINATTGAITALWTGITPQLRDWCYARGPSGGAPAGTCQIMTRAGSAVFNGLTTAGIAYTLNNVTSGASPLTFSGGSSGAWGYLINPTAIGALWPSAIGIGAYGLLLNSTTTRLAGPAPDTADTVHCRSNNQTILMDGNFYLFLFAHSSNFLWDDGTVWAGDTGTFDVKTNAGGAYSCGSALGIFLVNIGARTQGKLRFIAQNASSTLQITSSVNSVTAGPAFSRVTFDDYAAGGGQISIVPTSFTSIALVQCKFWFRRTAWYTLMEGGYGSVHNTFVDGCEFEWTALAASPTYLFGLGGMGSQCGSVVVSNCKAIGATPRVFGSSTTPAASYWNVRAVATNCAGFKLSSTLIGLLGVGVNTYPHEQQYVMQQAIGAQREFRLESNLMVLDWVQDGGYPTYDSQLPNGTPWSYRLLWGAAAGLRRAIPATVVHLTKTFVDTPATKTLTLELMVPSAVAASIKDDMLGITVAYVSNADSSVKLESSLKPYGIGTALASSAAAWTGNSYAGTHVARKITLTTSAAIKQNTEIEVTLIAADSAPGANRDIFINPEVGIS